MHDMVEDGPYQRASLFCPEALDLPTLRGSGSTFPAAKFEVTGVIEAWLGSVCCAKGSKAMKAGQSFGKQMKIR